MKRRVYNTVHNLSIKISVKQNKVWNFWKSLQSWDSKSWGFYGNGNVGIQLSIHLEVYEILGFLFWKEKWEANPLFVWYFGILEENNIFFNQSEKLFIILYSQKYFDYSKREWILIHPIDPPQLRYCYKQNPFSKLWILFFQQPIVFISAIDWTLAAPCCSCRYN